MVKKATWRRWTPTRETIEGMRAALGAHWAEATHTVHGSPFWPAPRSWLQRQAYHFTSGGKLIR